MTVTVSEVGAKGEIATGNVLHTVVGSSSAAGSSFLIGVVLFPTAAGGANVSGVPTDTVGGLPTGNMYVQVGTTIVTANGDLALAFYKCENGVGGAAHIATVNFANTNGFASAVLLQANDGTGIGPIVDIFVSNPSSSYSSGATLAVATGTLANAIETIIAMMAVDSGSGTGPWSSANLTILDNEASGATFWPFAIGEMQVTSATTVSPGFAYVSGGTNQANIIAASFQSNGTPPSDTLMAQICM